MTVADILKIYGKWIKSEDFANLVSKKLNIKERQAYRRIKKAWKDGEILRVTLPDRTVLYGLPEFGYPKFEEKTYEKTLSFTESFIFSCFKELQEINDIAVSDPRKALGLLTFLIKRLPQRLKEKIEPLRKERLLKLYSINPKKEEYDIQCLMIIEDLTDKISTLLHEYSNKS